MKKNVKNQKGFTIIEIMVVISMILILSSFLVPKIAGYQGKVKNMKAINTGRQIETVAMSSFAEQGGKFKEADVKSSIQTVLGLTIEDDKIVATDTAITINFLSDEKEYILAVDGTNNTYTVKLDKTILFSYTG